MRGLDTLVDTHTDATVCAPRTRQAGTCISRDRVASTRTHTSFRRMKEGVMNGSWYP